VPSSRRVCASGLAASMRKSTRAVHMYARK
jgi:hypothetical protein